MFKEKRAFTGVGATNTPAGATNQQHIDQYADTQISASSMEGTTPGQ